MSTVSGFSKLDKTAKIRWIEEKILNNEQNLDQFLKSFEYADPKEQENFEDFSENTISNYHLPFGVAPNFIINDRPYCIPMVIEESSVVAAACLGAKFWQTRGGFHSEIVSTSKVGQVHFYWQGPSLKLQQFFERKKKQLIDSVAEFEQNMRKRGGGLLDLELRNETQRDAHYYQLFATFETCNAMGANFINTILEALACAWKNMLQNEASFDSTEKEIDVVLAILSNYTPECLVRTSVQCRIKELGSFPDGITAQQFAQRFKRAVTIANIDPYRAATHNKGIFNGIDSVILATGNDFRAVEACGHAYAARSGQYQGLTECRLDHETFYYQIELPLALGTVGGLTSLHPLAKTSLKILGQPSAQELMSIASAAGLATHFGSLRSLVTYGIQRGHMRMHLKNLLKLERATVQEVVEAKKYFQDKTVSYNAVKEFLKMIRTAQ